MMKSEDYRRPKISYSDSWVDLIQFSELEKEKTQLVIFDKNIPFGKAFHKWMSANENVIAYPVFGGEKLKDVDNFPATIKDILNKTKGVGPKDLIVIGVGGGTVGDFSGFVASVLKRGVRLVHVPTTWLAAIDSSHGGKTALNVGSSKNQIGSFYQAESIFIIRSVLATQGRELENSAMGELFKMVLLKGEELAKSFVSSSRRDADLIWELLPAAIDGKYDFVSKDPFEQKGDRQFLNLGHTFGHVIELDCGIPHGMAVLVGTGFALNWSEQLGYMAPEDGARIKANMASHGVTELIEACQNRILMGSKLLDREQVKARLQQDKKCTSNKKFYFIFVKSMGQCIRKEVSLDDMLSELSRQKWI